MTTRKRIPSPAALALLSAGHTVVDLGRALGLSRHQASRILGGLRGVPDRLPSALADLVGADKAARVLDAIPPVKSRAGESKKHTR